MNINSEIAEQTAERAVAGGAKLLDTVNPGWREHIDLEWLDITNPNTCILGQLYGTYYRGFGQVFPHLDPDQASVVEQSQAAQLHGFDIGPWTNYGGAELNAAWAAEVTP